MSKKSGKETNTRKRKIGDKGMEEKRTTNKEDYR
jgi:hypothetical protein